MFSYQHSYHAGNLADTHKHAILSCLLHTMTQKEKPLTYIDMHAGRGVYQTTSPEAQKTQEATYGIVSALKEEWFPQEHPYMQAITAIKHQYGSDAYPGSPAIAATLLRKIDKIHLIEGHPQEFLALTKNMRQRHITCHHHDTYTHINTLIPPLIKRGIIIIDPSYEIKEEFQQIPSLIKHIHKKWNVATILLWYPLLPQTPHLNMIQTLEDHDFPKTWRHEVLFHNKKAEHHRMYGSGLFCINSPYGLYEALENVSTLFTHT